MLAALAFAQVLMMADAAPATALSARDAARYGACIAKIDVDANAAYEDAMAWANEEHVRMALQCAAAALVELGRHGEAAKRFEYLADSDMSGDKPFQIEALSQAANAWLLGGNPANARADLDRAIAMAPEEPDLLIDRARAFAMMAEWLKAEDDLSRALDARPDDALALRLRADARLQQGVLDLAERDAEAAVKLDPKNIEALLVRGNVRAAKAKKSGG